jgi:dihydrofolate synthase / folylpolyglutamate synthase
MDYQEALDYLSTFVNYEKKMTDQYAPEKMDPDRPGRLLQRLGDPHRQFPSIHIAGSKGKGSVAAMCASALRAAGLRVGLYTSPHLQDFRERIRILAGEDAAGLIPPERVGTLVARLQEAIPAVPGITWFELVTALGFMYFAEEGVDVAVVEVGLGGRLDATNVLQPLISVITRLELEHTALLGNTLDAIATEKGGIVKPGVPVVSAPQVEEAAHRLEAIAAERHAPFTLVGREWQAQGQAAAGLEAHQAFTVTVSPEPAFVPPGTTFMLPLLGEHQQENALVAVATLAAVHGQFSTLTLRALHEGLSSVNWPGRLQLLSSHPALVVDGAHTPQAARRLAKSLEALHPDGRLHLVVGATADKNVPAVLEPLLPRATAIYATQADNPRAATSGDVAAVITGLGYRAQPFSTVCAALQAAWTAAAEDDLICVTGSLYVVGDLLNCWEKLQSTLLTCARDAAAASRDKA